MKMNFLFLKQIFDGTHHLSKVPVGTIIKILPSLKIKKIKAGQAIYNEGDIDSNVYILLSGHLKGYFNVDGTEAVTVFFSKGDVVSCAPTKYCEGKAWVTMQAVTDVTVIYLTKEKYISFFSKNKLMYSLFTESIKKVIWLHRTKLENIMVNTAPERYQHFVSSHEDILPYISVKEMAAYLNLSRETISRIRNQETKKGRKKDECRL